MKKILLIKFIFLLIFTSSCETVKKKSDEIVKNYRQKLLDKKVEVLFENSLNKKEASNKRKKSQIKLKLEDKYYWGSFGKEI